MISQWDKLCFRSLAKIGSVHEEHLAKNRLVIDHSAKTWQQDSFLMADHRRFVSEMLCGYQISHSESFRRGLLPPAAKPAGFAMSHVIFAFGGLATKGFDRGQLLNPDNPYAQGTRGHA